ncbi:MAG: secretion system protein, partial [Haloarculaceae archaeon]
MAIDETGGGGSDDVESGGADGGTPLGVGDYTWKDLRREFHQSGRFDRSAYLGYEPRQLPEYFEAGASAAKTLHERHRRFLDPETVPVTKGVYTWEHFKREYYYTDGESAQPINQGEVVEFDPAEFLGFDPEETERRLSRAESMADRLADVVDARTVDVNEDLDEDEFFSTREGHTTVANRYDLERAVPLRKKAHFVEIERYWVNKPHAFVILFHSKKENEKKYYVVEPHLNAIEDDLREFSSKKLRSAIKYSEDDVVVQGTDADRAQVIEREARRLFDRYGLYTDASNGKGVVDQLKDALGMAVETDERDGKLEGIEARPEAAILEDDPKDLNEYQVEKLLYVLERDFIGYSRIDPIKHDINVEDISCDGY